MAKEKTRFAASSSAVRDQVFPGVAADARPAIKPYHVVPDASTEIVGERASNTGVWLFSLVVFTVVALGVLGLFELISGEVGFFSILCAVLLAGLATMSVHIAQQWEKVAQWGVTILSVEVRDILLPRDLQDVMSLEAQAEQRKKARIILMEAEQDVTEMLDAMSEVYERNEVALRLRAMHLLYESVRETGGTVVVPSSFSEGFGDVLGDLKNDPLRGVGR